MGDRVTELVAGLPAELRAVASPRVGIVAALEECMVDVDEPPLHRVSCELAAAEEVLGSRIASARSGAGAGSSIEQAAGAAIGEAIERYSASFVPLERLVVATAAELGPRAADPAGFGLFAAAQYARPGFAYEPFTRETRVPWVAGLDLVTGEQVWVPAELVFLQNVGPAERERIGYATSNGLACAPTRADALERALLELLERDAFMVTWWRRLSPPRLDWSEDQWLAQADRRYFRSTGLEYTALDLSPAHDLPIVAAVVRGANGSGAALGVGAAAAPRVEDAWWRALAEAFASRSACRKLRLLDPDRIYASDGSDVVSFDDHIRFYGEDEAAELAAFLWSSAETRSAGDIPALSEDAAVRLEQIVARIGRAGSAAFAVDVTSPDVAAAGLHVIRALAPGLCPLDAAHTARFLGSPRLSGAAGTGPSEKDILTGRVLGLDDLNPLPHPFP
jgi:ribosomal protein S12 methylthiotransferase accessory factor